jgi:hypothetical protein
MQIISRELFSYRCNIRAQQKIGKIDPAVLRNWQIPGSNTDRGTGSSRGGYGNF